jgi:hypothetical protein
MNILLMGLESRTYWNGEPLPKTLEDAMHIGSIGGDTTNTLILLHIYELQQLQQNGQAAKLSRDQLYFEANEAGRAAEIDTVEQLTGVHIDHFAELNLWGFYELASIFGPSRCASRSRRMTPTSPGRTSRRATTRSARRRRWRSSGSGRTCPTGTWTARTGSRPSSTT